MQGHTVPATGISYHETHTLTPDGRVPARFGNPIEIPEDLMPIGTERPEVMSASHPLARFVKVYEADEAPSIGREPVDDVVFVDQETGTVVQMLVAKGPDAFGAYSFAVLTDRFITVEYDEEAIAKENDRRLKKTMEIAAMYAAVIDAHVERVAREQAARDAARESQQSTEQVTPTQSPTDGNEN